MVKWFKSQFKQFWVLTFVLLLCMTAVGKLVFAGIAIFLVLWLICVFYQVLTF